MERASAFGMIYRPAVSRKRRCLVIGAAMEVISLLALVFMQSLANRFRVSLLPALLILLVTCGLNGLLPAQQRIGELYATDASVKGSVILAGSGTMVLSGSSIEAGAQTATLKLERGGNVMICGGTKLSITASQNGREMLFSLNTGNLELNYPIGTEADTLLTPDLRLLMPGPGTVHVAVRVTPQGDTCVQSLPSNAAAIVVSESMGDATYQVKPSEAVLFRGGRLGESSPAKDNCGCPKPPPTQVAKSVPPPPPAQPQQAPAPVAAATPPPVLPSSSQPMAAAVLPKYSMPTPPEQHLAVSAPFIYRADDPVPDLTENVAILRLENNKVIQLEPTVLPPPNTKKSAAKNTHPVEKQTSHGFFSKVGSFFASIFH